MCHKTGQRKVRIHGVEERKENPKWVPSDPILLDERTNSYFRSTEGREKNIGPCQAKRGQKWERWDLRLRWRENWSSSSSAVKEGRETWTQPHEKRPTN